MTAANTFTLTVPADRVVQLPGDVPLGRVTLSVVETSPKTPEERLAARRSLWGSMPELAALGDSLLAPMDEAELQRWHSPIEPPP